MFPRQPLVGAVLAAVSGIMLAEFLSAPIEIFCLITALGATLCLARRAGWLAHFLLGAAFFVLHLSGLADAPGKAWSERLGDRSRPVVVTGVVADEPRLSVRDYTTFLLRLTTITLGGKSTPCSATIRARWQGMPQLGDELCLHGIIEPIPPPRNPGVFDLRAYLARRDVYNSVFARETTDGTILRSGSAYFGLRLAMRARNWMAATVARDLEDSPEVVSMINGMALGIRHETPNDIEEPFQQTGTLHLFAVAGLHVGIIAQLLWIVTSLLRFPRRTAAAVTIPALFCYSAITGLHVSSVRAATMSAFLLGGIFFERPVFALNSLAAAGLFILATDSNQLFSSGFQLSFAVVGAILLFRETIFRLLLRFSESDPFLPRSLVSNARRIFERVYRAIAGGISVSGAAWAGSLALIIWYFYLITPISLLANLLVVPIAFCVLSVCLISLLSAPFSSTVSIALNNANWCLAKLILAMVQLFAQLPMGHLYIEPPNRPNNALTEITALDAGAGAAVHLRDGGSDWLFDAGSSRDYENFLRDYLHSRGINRVNGLVLSHGDSLHIGGAIPLLDEFQPGRVIDSGATDRSRIHRTLLVRLKRHEVATRGEELAISRRIRARFLYPGRGSHARAADDLALVIQLIVDQKYRVLLVSDSGPITEAALLAHPNELQSDILIKGQHHSGESGSPDFLNAVRPRLIVASSVDFPARERIPDAWASLVRERGIRLFRQDETGAVRLEFFHDEWRATGFLNHETFSSSSR